MSYKPLDPKPRDAEAVLLARAYAAILKWPDKDNAHDSTDLAESESCAAVSPHLRGHNAPEAYRKTP